MYISYSQTKETTIASISKARISTRLLTYYSTRYFSRDAYGSVHRLQGTERFCNVPLGEAGLDEMLSPYDYEAAIARREWKRPSVDESGSGFSGKAEMPPHVSITSRTKAMGTAFTVAQWVFRICIAHLSICISPEHRVRPSLNERRTRYVLGVQLLRWSRMFRCAQYCTAVAQWYRPDTQSEVLQPMWDGFVVVLLTVALLPPMCMMLWKPQRCYMW